MAVPDWSELHPELLEQVAIKLIEIEDFTAFRGVCRSWRGAVAEIKDKLVCKIPQLMFLDKEGGGLYSWRKRKIFSKAMPPELKFQFRCIGVGFGWILAEEELSGELSLVNPRSCAKIQAPSTKLNDTMFIRNAVLSVNPSENSDFMVIAVVGDNYLGFWRNGDEKWSMIEETNYQGRTVHTTICYHKRKLYAVSFCGKLWMWDPYHLNQTGECIMEFDFNLDFPFEYLVESCKGELLLIHRNHNPTAMFNIFQIDTEKRKCVTIQSLDGDAIFVDLFSAVSVAATDFPGIVKPNCIYYPNGNWKPPRLEIYNVDQPLDHEGLDVPYSEREPLQWLL